MNIHNYGEFLNVIFLKKRQYLYLIFKYSYTHYKKGNYLEVITYVKRLFDLI
jgi:hypothetical protein